jgi:hypothetical protein
VRRSALGREAGQTRRCKGFPEGFFFPALLMIAYSGGLAAGAWVVRQLVAEQGVSSEILKSSAHSRLSTAAPPVEAYPLPG